MIPDLATLRDRASPGSRKRIFGLAEPRLERLAPHLVALRDAVAHPGRPRDPAGALGALDRQHGLRDLADPGLAHDASSRPTSSPARLLRLRHGADAADRHPPDDGPGALHHAAAPRGDGQGHRCSPARWSASPTRPSSSSPGTAATSTSASTFINRATGPYAWGFWTDGAVQRAVPQLLWWQAAARPQRAGAVRRSRSWSTSACGSSASSSSSPRCTATSCRRAGRCTTRRCSRSASSSAASACSSRCSCCSSGSLPMIAMWEVKSVAAGEAKS